MLLPDIRWLRSNDMIKSVRICLPTCSSMCVSAKYHVFRRFCSQTSVRSRSDHMIPLALLGLTKEFTPSKGQFSLSNQFNHVPFGYIQINDSSSSSAKYKHMQLPYCKHAKQALRDLHQGFNYSYEAEEAVAFSLFQQP